MRSSRPSSGLVLALLPLLAACGNTSSAPKPVASGAPAPAASGAAPEATVARVGDERISAAELDAAVAGQLMRLRQEEYDLRRARLKELIEERLLAREAKARGQSVEQLLAAEVDAKVATPTAGEVATFYETYRARMGGRTLEQVRGEIATFLVDRSRQQRRAELTRQLSEKAGTQQLLVPPRFEPRLPKDAPALGPADAPVVVVEYADYQCPYCQRAEENVQALLRRYPGRLRLVHRDYPLGNHPQAQAAAEAAHCAGEQGRFFEYRHGLMVEPGDMQEADLRRRAAALKLDLPAFGSCLSTRRHRARVEASLKEGQDLGVSSTPTFFVNGRMVLGARPLEDFVEIVEEELKGAPGGAS